MKYQSYSTHCSKIISKVKVSERRTERQNYRMKDRTKTLTPPPHMFTRTLKSNENTEQGGNSTEL